MPQAVMTGHDNGLITLALKEADDAMREKVRGEMGEPYRTLLGHFRHESGHYFWDRLVATDAGLAGRLPRFVRRRPRRIMPQALQRHYDEGAPPDWQDNYVSMYATTHPWEDFAETWAHYLHIVDTLETAGAFGLKVRPRARARRIWRRRSISILTRRGAWTKLIDAWLPIEFATNSLNRSMGLIDLYPFVLSPKVIEKLGFVHALTHGERCESCALAATGRSLDRARQMDRLGDEVRQFAIRWRERGRTRLSGRCTVTRVPLPTSLSRVTWPPWASARPLTMARPRPVPLSAMATSCLPWPKLSNTRLLVLRRDADAGVARRRTPCRHRRRDGRSGDVAAVPA